MLTQVLLNSARSKLCNMFITFVYTEDDNKQRKNLRKTFVFCPALLVVVFLQWVDDWFMFLT